MEFIGTPINQDEFDFRFYDVICINYTELAVKNNKIIKKNDIIIEN